MRNSSRSPSALLTDDLRDPSTMGVGQGRVVVERRLRRRLAYRSWVVRSASVVAFLLLWEAVGRLGDARRVPPASEVFVRLAAELATPEFWSAAWTTLSALAIGLAISIVGGIAFGMVFGVKRNVAEVSRLYIGFLIAVPIAPLIPLLVAVFGLGPAVRVAAIVIFSFPMVAEYTIAGIHAISPSVLDMARSFRVPPVRRFLRLLIPGAVPGIMTGIRLGVGRAVIGMVVAELIIVSTGIGALLKRYQATFDPVGVFALVIVFLAVGLLLVQLVSLAERRFLVWR